MTIGAVAAGHPETCRAALSILAAGGNAVDAALGAMIVACVAEPALASLGGGGFLLSAMETGRHAGRIVVHDFFVNTPGRLAERPAESDFRAVHAEFGTARQEFHIGRAAIAVPGVPRGLFAVHADLGHMPLKDVVEPGIRAAREGVVLAEKQAEIINIIAAICTATPQARALFRSPQQPDRLIQAGERLTMPALADVLEALVTEGADLFYRGEIARQIIADVAPAGSPLTMADFAHYRVEHRAPVAIDVAEARICLNPPPASGGVLVALALLLTDRAALLAGGPGSAAALRHLAGVMAATDEARREASRTSDDEAAALARFLHPEFIGRWRAEILGLAPASRGTTHISVIDRAGNAAALSLSNGEGSGYVVPGTDIMLNNMLGEADLCPRGFHRWAAGRRMTSMMTPALVKRRDGTRIVLGSGGSNRIRTAMLQVLVNRLIFGLAVEAAIAAPRIHYEEGTLSIEPGLREGELAQLMETYRDARVWPARSMFFGGVHAAERQHNGTFAAAADDRRGGTAAAE